MTIKNQEDRLNLIGILLIISLVLVLCCIATIWISVSVKLKYGWGWGVLIVGVLLGIGYVGLRAIAGPLLERVLMDYPSLRNKLAEQLQAHDAAENLRHIIEEGGPLVQTILESLKVSSMEELQAILQQHPELYSKEGIALLDRIKIAETRPQVREMLSARKLLYERCQKIGIDAAFIEIASKDISSETLSLLQELTQPIQKSDLTRRIELCRHALEANPRHIDPDIWAGLQCLLANSLSQTPKGDRSENIEQAIYHNQQALEVFTQRASPDLWAMIQINLAGVYINRIQGNRSANIERAIQHGQQALEIFTKRTNPEEWGMAQNNLGNAYSARIHGDRAENIEQAIHHYQLDLTARTRRSYPEFWAMTQNNLANAFRRRLHGDRAENIEQAIRHFKLVLDVHTRETFPEFWAMTQNNIATAYYDRKQGERVENIEQTIYHYQQALEILTQKTDPERWASIQINLGSAYVERMHGERSENIEQAIHHYQQALEIFTQQTDPERWAATHNNLGTAYSNRVFGECNENIEQAIHHHQQALEFYSPQTFPMECRMTARNLGNLGFEQGNWLLALAGFETALLAHLILMRSASLRKSKEAELREIKNVYSRTAYAYAQLGKVDSALATLEFRQAQLLRDALEHNRRDLEMLAEIGHKKLYDHYQIASQRVRELQSIVGDETRPDDWMHLMDIAQAEIRAVIDEIRQVPGYESFFRSLTATQIQAHAKDVPLVYLSATSAGGLAIIVVPDDICVIWLDGLTDIALLEKVLGPDEDPGGYLGAYDNWLRSSANRATNQSATTAWLVALDEITAWLWHLVMGPIIDCLNTLKLQEALLIPSGLLSMLPLHAAWKEDTTTPTGRRYVLDEIACRYAPSARALQEAMEVETHVDALSLLVIDNPDGSLHFSTDEVTTALVGFDKALQLSGTQANRQAVLDSIAHHTVLHFSTHGVAEWFTPLQSKLKLSDGYLTLDELLNQQLPGARLAVLSACETGIPGMVLLDEIISLPAGFMQAGVAGVVASLWSVADVSTAMLMARFYELWRKDNLELPEALRQAQLWLRDSTDGEKKRYFQSSLPEFVGLRLSEEIADSFFKAVVFNNPDAHSFAHPFYWAAFTYTGV